MANLRVYERQSMLDVAVQHLGGVESVFDLALSNGLSITDDLNPNDSLIGCESVASLDIVEYFSNRGVVPFTAPTAYDLEHHPVGGINFMGVESDFIVS